MQFHGAARLPLPDATHHRRTASVVTAGSQRLTHTIAISIDEHEARGGKLEGVPMTILAAGVKHQHDRPAWHCRACSLPWPCADAKASLHAEFRGFPSALALYMSAQMGDALRDVEARGGPPINDFYERFLLWIRRSDDEAPPTAVTAQMVDHLDREAQRWSEGGDGEAKAAPADIRTSRQQHEGSDT